MFGEQRPYFQGIDRRSFLKGFAWTLAAAMVPLPAAAKVFEGWGNDPPEGEVLPETPVVRSEDNLPGPYCKGELRLVSGLRTGEEYLFRYRDERGNYDQDILNRLNWFLRCADGSWQYMDVVAIESLNYMSKLLGDPLIRVHSAYRSPSYNAKLAVNNENVARNSLHMYGKALDFSIKGVDTRTTCSYALLARNTIGSGGVGFYPRAGFVHLDSGPTRQWVK